MIPGCSKLGNLFSYKFKNLAAYSRKPLKSPKMALFNIAGDVVFDIRVKFPF
jgi:hypothetical protein